REEIRRRWHAATLDYRELAFPIVSDLVAQGCRVDFPQSGVSFPEAPQRKVECRQDRDLAEPVARALRVNIESTDAFQVGVEQIETYRQLHRRREHVDQVAAHRELPRLLHHR